MNGNGIEQLIGREVLDSRGNPTLEVDVRLASGHSARMMVPSGASTGKHEAWEARDLDKRYRGLGVRKAAHLINATLNAELMGFPANEQEQLDQWLLQRDGSANKITLGGNVILGISLAVAKASAAASELPFYRYLQQFCLPPEAGTTSKIPTPMVNMISGGLHAGGNIDLQDFMILPNDEWSYPDMLEAISDVYWKVKELLRKKGYSTLLADEGGFGPRLSSNEEALEILCDAIAASSFKLGEDISIAIDVAASHFYDESLHVYRLKSERRELTTLEMIEVLESWVRSYPIVSIEDGLAEDDWEGWQAITSRLGGKVQLVGDDLFTTNPDRIQTGIDRKAANAVLIKMNQIGTLTETISAVRLAKSAGFRTVISARSGETEDATLADLAVGLGGDQIKIGSLARSSRLSKYNQLLRIYGHLNGEFYHY